MTDSEEVSGTGMIPPMARSAGPEAPADCTPRLHAPYSHWTSWRDMRKKGKGKGLSEQAAYNDDDDDDNFALMTLFFFGFTSLTFMNMCARGTRCSGHRT